MGDVVSLQYHLETLRRHDRRADEKFQTERDRRYTEVALEREKALQIKEKADDRALDLARQIQTYKDEQANELRSQIESERGTYATQSDLRALDEKIATALAPVLTYVAGEQRHDSGIQSSRTLLIGAIGAVVVFVNLIFYIAR